MNKQSLIDQQVADDIIEAAETKLYADAAKRDKAAVEAAKASGALPKVKAKAKKAKEK